MRARVRLHAHAGAAERAHVIPRHDQAVRDALVHLARPRNLGGGAERYEQATDVERSILDQAEDGVDGVRAIAGERDFERRRVFEQERVASRGLDDVRDAIPPVRAALGDERGGNEENRPTIMAFEDGEGARVAVEVAVVEGDGEWVRRELLPGAPAAKLFESHEVEVALQVAELEVEVLFGHVDDAVVERIVACWIGEAVIGENAQPGQGSVRPERENRPECTGRVEHVCDTLALRDSMQLAAKARASFAPVTGRVRSRETRLETRALRRSAEARR